MKFSSFLRTALAALCLMLCVLPSQGAAPSGALPVMYVNTENGTPITSKEEYLAATYYLDPCGAEGVEAFGSEAEQLPLQIRGRGNWTWVGYDKKPYRIKLEKKAALLGMKKSKHFALLAHADDNLGFMRNHVGMELSRRLKLAWTPSAQPVEVVINGDYIGLYFLTETIRVDQDRVNIVEQLDNETDPEKITGGWLVEIDNYDSDPHVSIPEGNTGERIIFTYKTPELLSPEQENYLRTQMTAIDNAIFAEDKNDAKWVEMIDMESLARFYVVQEIMDDCESFHGSCYLHRDMGADKKWTFGPVWDFGNSMMRGDKCKFIYDEPAFHQTWIGEVAKFPAFQEKVKEVWKEFAEDGYKGLIDWIDSETARMKTAAASDAERWPNYGNADLVSRVATFKELLKNSTNWLSMQWGTPITPELPPVYLRGDFNGWDTTHPLEKVSDGVYTIAGVDMPLSENPTFKVASADWSTVDLGATPDVNLEMNKEYPLTEHGKNIRIPRELKNATFTVNIPAKTLVVTDATGIDSVVDSESAFTVSGRTLTAATPVEVFTVAGVKVWSGIGNTTLQPAIYIVRTADGGAEKILVR